ncbi:hypothetical protein [Propionimicrobium sp. PCR01-08-3]|uniref:hypothetical protein n=1 Tax=Propionimicrobium sp. PCR01-08-3 TaxID=3052086 RepID=UPI00255CD1C0|nr:hypothetical protein [Propionimicrobium sp. PCR01-08-3]WIY84062.1 hypothetical protein QQ658_06915 [Propionimicrobium sp. PCR01-08-3]
MTSSDEEVARGDESQATDSASEARDESASKADPDRVRSEVTMPSAPAGQPAGSSPGGKRSAKPSRKSVLLRLDPVVYDALAKWAADDLRSVNSLIEKLLRDDLKRSGRAVKAGPMRKPGRPRSS